LSSQLIIAFCGENNINEREINKSEGKKENGDPTSQAAWRHQIVAYP